jgi:RNA 3'-terminal phosphate cyclase
MFREPGAGSLVQRGNCRRLCSHLQNAPQGVAKQVVKTVPGTVLIKRHKEQLRASEFFQEGVTGSACGLVITQDITEFGAKPLANAGGEQEALCVWWL